MALCLCHSLKETGKFSVRDVACSYSYWVNSSCLFTNQTMKNAFRHSKLFLLVWLPVRKNLDPHTVNFKHDWRNTTSNIQFYHAINRIKYMSMTKNLGMTCNTALLRITPLVLRYYNTSSTRDVFNSDLCYYV